MSLFQNYGDTGNLSHEAWPETQQPGPPGQVPAQEQPQTLLRIEDLSLSFGENQVLKGISLDIPEKSLFALAGQSGTGKSVLIKAVIGILQPSGGRIWYRDTEISAPGISAAGRNAPERNAASRNAAVLGRNRFGYSFQNAALFDSMNVEENLAFPLVEVMGIKGRGEVQKRVKELLEWIELPGIELKYPDELSGGMRKRVGVARALALQPEALFFDEPTTGLDPVLSETINKLVLRVNRELGITCVMITHDIPAAFRMADRIAFMGGGRILACGTPEEAEKSDHPLIRDFVRISLEKRGVNHESPQLIH